MDFILLVCASISGLFGLAIIKGTFEVMLEERQNSTLRPRPTDGEND